MKDRRHHARTVKKGCWGAMTGVQGIRTSERSKTGTTRKSGKKNTKAMGVMNIDRRSGKGKTESIPGSKAQV